MIVYFKKGSNVLMILGGVTGLLLGFLYLNPFANFQKDMTIPFWIVLWGFTGIILGRFLAALRANHKLQKIQALLYRETDPRAFLSAFAGRNQKIPHRLAEYVSGQVMISFAHEALGEYEEAFQAIRELKPEELKLHTLASTALVQNQKTNLYILKQDYEGAENLLSDLKALQEVSVKRARTIAEQLKFQLQLHETRIAMGRGEKNADRSFMEEEIRLSSNLIHQKEMQLEYANYLLTQEEREAAKELLQEILKNPRGLDTEKKAEELLRFFLPTEDKHL